MSSGSESRRVGYRLHTAQSRPGWPNHPTQRAVAFVLAGGRGSRLHQLTDARAKPAVPFAGKLRIIDFSLSNCVNSGVRRIIVLTQYKAQSLIRHIERGWSFLASSLGEYIDVAPAQQQIDESWYRGTADAVYQNLKVMLDAGAEQVLILAGDHVYKMDYAVMLAENVERKADLSVACLQVPLAQAGNFGVLTADADGRLLTFEEKPDRPAALADSPDAALVSMGIYVFDAAALCEQLEQDAAQEHSTHDFARDIIPRMLGRDRVFVHHFADSCVNRVGTWPYWRDVGTIDAYWEANMDLTRTVPELNLYDDQWPIFSHQPQLPPAKFVFDDDERRGMALNSVVSGGCIVSGATVRRSVLFAKVRVNEHSYVEDSLVLPDVVIGRHVTLRRAIVDRRCVLPDGFAAGIDAASDRERFHVTARGITLVTPTMLGQPDHGHLGPDTEY